MRTQLEQIEKDIQFCIDKCGMTDKQTNNFINAADEIGVNCEYFAEEFIFESHSDEEFERLHNNPDYLKINWRLN